MRPVFEQKLGLARTVFPYVENHNFYIEHWSLGVFWRKMRELNRLLMAAGFWSDPEGLFFLSRNEVRDALWDYCCCLGRGRRPDRTALLAAADRGAQKDHGCALPEHRPEPALNEPPEVVTEPFTIMLWGITSDRISAWLKGPTDSSQLEGMAASPGVVEGLARVIRSPDELDQIQDGEILVAPVTAPSWAPVFCKISATVTDIGGMMSHAAIVCREYGLPAVTATGTASSVIKTGQRLRVDGSAGTVECSRAEVEFRDEHRRASARFSRPNGRDIRRGRRAWAGVRGSFCCGLARTLCSAMSSRTRSSASPEIWRNVTASSASWACRSM